MYKNNNDYELLYLIADNDDEAYNNMFHKYRELVKIESNKIYRKSKYLGVSKDDIYQAGLFALTQAIKNYNEKCGVLFYTFASTYINRELQTFIRDKSRNKHMLLTDSISLDKEIDGDGNSLLIFIEGENNTDKIYDSCIRYKEILDLKYKLSFFYSMVYELRLNNFTNKEISILLNRDYKSIDNAITKIKKHLKKEVNQIALF